MAIQAASIFTSATVVLFPAKIPRRSRAILLTQTLIVRTPKSITASRRFLPTPLRAAPPRKYVYPDPIPEFAAAETEKFKSELYSRLLKENEISSRDELDAVVDVCAEIFSEFLHDEYGGPGTLLVEPFTDMFVALKGRKLPGAPLAARVSLLWAQKYVDQDWEIWNSKHP